MSPFCSKITRMAHLSENSSRLKIQQKQPRSSREAIEEARGFDAVCVLRLPHCSPDDFGRQLVGAEQFVLGVTEELGPNAVLVVLGESLDLVHVHAAINTRTLYQHWISIKRSDVREFHDRTSLPQHHFGALVHTNYKGSLKHAKTRIRYAYCPSCNKTTKDYGGKKHTYHEYGTLMSDVWRDIACDFEGDISPVLERLADLFGVEPYKELRLIDCRSFLERSGRKPGRARVSEQRSFYQLPKDSDSKLMLGDCIERLAGMSDDSVDFAFADPPYNLKKKYAGYADDLAIAEYFDWCDRWITEMARVLRPGKTLALLNIPLWAIRHFLHLEKVLKFQSWIAWDALSYPVRKIMPSHYAILCFSKGEPRELPGLDPKQSVGVQNLTSPSFPDPLEPLAEGFCLRQQCLKNRSVAAVNDRGTLTDLWWDVHRLKHNSRRVDHPTQLPPQFMRRLISVFTRPGEMVLDCFNGAGTTTLTAHQLGRKYTGIEVSEKYYEIARARHEEVRQGMDPFRKVDRVLTAKNSPVPRRLKQKYEVSKRELQLEVKRVAAEIGRLPTRSEIEKLGRYQIRYYNEYFASWGEVCAAARTTGMTESFISTVEGSEFGAEQPSLLENLVDEDAKAQ